MLSLPRKSGGITSRSAIDRDGYGCRYPANLGVSYRSGICPFLSAGCRYPANLGVSHPGWIAADFGHVVATPQIWGYHISKPFIGEFTQLSLPRKSGGITSSSAPDNAARLLSLPRKSGGITSSPNSEYCRSSCRYPANLGVSHLGLLLCGGFRGCRYPANLGVSHPIALYRIENAALFPMNADRIIPQDGQKSAWGVGFFARPVRDSREWRPCECERQCRCFVGQGKALAAWHP